MEMGDFLSRFNSSYATLSGKGAAEPAAPSPEPVAAPAPQPAAEDFYPAFSRRRNEAHQPASTKKQLDKEAAELAALRHLHTLGLHFIHGGAYQRTRALKPDEMEKLEAMFTKELRMDVGFKPHHEADGELYVTVVQHKLGNKIASLTDLGPAPLPSASR